MVAFLVRPFDRGAFVLIHRRHVFQNRLGRAENGNERLINYGRDCFCIIRVRPSCLWPIDRGRAFLWFHLFYVCDYVCRVIETTNGGVGYTSCRTGVVMGAIFFADALQFIGRKVRRAFVCFERTCLSCISRFNLPSPAYREGK